MSVLVVLIDVNDLGQTDVAILLTQYTLEGHPFEVFVERGTIVSTNNLVASRVQQ